MSKEVACAVEVPLSIIFNNCLHSSTIPTAWKEGNIVPISILYIRPMQLQTSEFEISGMQGFRINHSGLNGCTFDK